MQIHLRELPFVPHRVQIAIVGRARMRDMHSERVIQHAEFVVKQAESEDPD